MFAAVVVAAKPVVEFTRLIVSPETDPTTVPTGMPAPVTLIPGTMPAAFATVMLVEVFGTFATAVRPTGATP